MKSKSAQFSLILASTSLAYVLFMAASALLLRAARSPAGPALGPVAILGAGFLALVLLVLGRNAQAFGGDYSGLEGKEGYEAALARLGGRPLISLIEFFILAGIYSGLNSLFNGGLGLTRTGLIELFLFNLSFGLLGAAFVFVLGDRLVLDTLLSARLSTFPSSLREARQRRKIFIIPLFMALMSLVFAFSTAFLLGSRGGEAGFRLLPAIFIFSGAYFGIVIALLVIWNSATALLYSSLLDQLDGLNAAERNLSGRVSIASVDELGSLAGRINDFCSGLQAGLRQVAETNRELAAVQGELFQGIRASSLATKDIGESLEGTMGAIEAADSALAASLAQAKALAGHVAAATAELRELETRVSSSREGVMTVMAAVGELARDASTARDKSGELGLMVKDGETGVGAIVETVRAVAQRSADLGKINNLIAGVASRTNLLAMNAAIEAAHAGASGAGFSVVAEEIRTLAESTAQHTRMSKDSLREILGLIESSLRSAESAGSSFGLIRAAAGEVEGLSAGLATAMKAEEKRSEAILGHLAETDSLGKAVAGRTASLDGVSGRMTEELSRAASAQAEARRLALAMKTRDDELGKAVAGVDGLSGKTAELASALAAFLSSFKT
jgi:methyl-accepting chemotaxis protein